MISPALAVLIASRSEQSDVSHTPSSVSSVLVTLRVAAWAKRKAPNIKATKAVNVNNDTASGSRRLRRVFIEGLFAMIS